MSMLTYLENIRQLQRNNEIAIDLIGSYKEEHHKLGELLISLQKSIDSAELLCRNTERSINNDTNRMRRELYKFLIQLSNISKPLTELDLWKYNLPRVLIQDEYKLITCHNLYEATINQYPTEELFIETKDDNLRKCIIDVDGLCKYYKTIFGRECDRFPDYTEIIKDINKIRQKLANNIAIASNIINPVGAVGGKTTAFDDNNTKIRSRNFKIFHILIAGIFIASIREFVDTGYKSTVGWIGILVAAIFGIFDCYMVTNSHKATGWCNCLSIFTGRRQIHISDEPTLEKTKNDRNRLCCSYCFC